MSTEISTLGVPAVDAPEDPLITPASTGPTVKKSAGCESSGYESSGYESSAYDLRPVAGEESRSRALRRFWTERLRDYLELTKPRIAVLELVTVTVGALAAASLNPIGWMRGDWVLAHALLGTWLVASSASVFNQIWERETDGVMSRTAKRPLPAGRLGLLEASVFGVLTGVLGIAELAWMVNPLTAGLGALSWLLYVLIYTPMKTRTAANTIVGAFPGALPIVMGWTSAGGTLGLPALVLFGIVFFWQFPHFMAIAWLCREDYRFAGLQMITGFDPRGILTGATAVATSLVLIVVSLAALGVGLSSWTYATCALLLGLGLLAASISFLRQPDRRNALRLLRASLLYLPLLLIALVYDLPTSY